MNDFIEIFTENIKRDGSEGILEWLKSKDFFTAPASTMYHGAFEGGLVKHSLNVYKQLKRLLACYPEIECSEETAAIISLLHDVCKVDVYATEKRNRKNDKGVWEQYDHYIFKEKFCFGGHGSKSVYLIQHYMPLEPIEAVAINCHMGAFADEHVGKSYEKYPLAWLLHVADEAASYLDETEE